MARRSLDWTPASLRPLAGNCGAAAVALRPGVWRAAGRVDSVTRGLPRRARWKLRRQNLRSARPGGALFKSVAKEHFELEGTDVDRRPLQSRRALMI
jgi:hypothetical protein